MLEPLAMIAPQLIDPLTGRTIAALHADLLAKMEDGTLEQQQITVSEWPRDEH